MKSTEAKGKSVDEAIFNGLKELNLSIDEVEIKILEEGSRGIFGLGKSAKVLLTEKQEEVEEAAPEIDFVKKLFDLMSVKCKLVTRKENGVLYIDAQGDNLGALIGRRGETLDALQYIISLVVNKDRDDYLKVSLDTENYRRKREATLVKLAKRLAAKTKKTGQKTVLEPMNPYERRILHSTLQNDPAVTTYSEGEEPYRHVVIDIKKDNN